MSLRYVSVVFVAAILATVAILAASAIQPGKAEAAGTVAVKGCTGTNVTLTSAESRMLSLHKAERRKKGLPQLCVHPSLQRAARAHSQDMINRDFFSHTNPSGKTFAARVRQAGYKYRVVGENISGGSGSLGLPDHRFQSWMGSTGHRKNILNKSFREVGIGAANGNYRGTDNYTMWTADFGSR